MGHFSFKKGLKKQSEYVLKITNTVKTLSYIPIENIFL